MTELLEWMQHNPLLTAWIAFCIARAKPLTLFYRTTEVGKRKHKTVVERQYEADDE